MKAVYIEERGGPDKHIYGDVQDPVMGDDQVLIRIRAASINRFDLNARAGENGVMVGLPRVLGLDMAGEIVDASVMALEAGYLPGARRRRRSPNALPNVSLLSSGTGRGLLEPI